MINSHQKGMKEFKMLADFDNANFEFYDKYGDVTAPAYYPMKDGSIVNVKHNVLFTFEPKDISTDEAFQKLMKHKTVNLPNREAGYRFKQAIDNFNSHKEETDVFGKFELARDYTTDHKFTQYWNYLSDKRHDVQVGDTVQFGVSFRNGVGTNVSLGGDIYSYRLACSNGSIVKDVRLGSFNIPHIISADRMLEKLTDYLSEMIQNYKKVLEYYRMFSRTQLTQQIVNKILRQVDLPLKYLPEDILEVTTRRDDPELERPVIKLRRNDFTMWDLFNGITSPLTLGVNTDRSTKKLKKVPFDSFANKTGNLHKAMIQVVTAK